MSSDDVRKQAVKLILEQLIQSFPDKTILTVAEHIKASGGFRKNSSSSARLMLKTALNQHFPDIPENFRAEILKRTPGARLLNVLPLKTICDTLGGFVKQFGEAETIAYLLLCSTKEVRDHGIKLLATSLDESLLSVQAEDFNLLFASIATSSSETALPTVAERQAEKSRLDAIRQELQQERKKTQGHARTLEALKNAETKLAQTQQLLDEKLSELSTLRAEHTRLSQTYATLQAHTQERIDASVESRLATEFYGWLKVAKPQEELSQHPDTNLLVDAERILANQASIDRASGNRVKLLAELEQLRKLQVRTLDLLSNSLVQTPELPLLAQRLQERIDQLLVTLSPEPQQELSPLDTTLQQAVLSATGAQLPKLRTLADTLKSLKILSPERANSLQAIWRKRYDLLQATGGFLDKDAPNEDEDLSPTIRHLQNAFLGQFPAVIMLDGHNVVFGIKNRYSPQRGRFCSEAAKREALVRDFKTLLEGVPTLRGWIFFDGATRSDASPTSNLRVSYSGGTGEHRADNALLDQIRAFRAEPNPLEIFLVTNDGELRGKAQKLNAIPVLVQQFAGFLQGA